MKAAVHSRYGPPEVLRVTDVPRPVPRADEMLVRVVASSVTRTDTGFRGLEYPFSRLLTGVRRPRRQISGMEFAGVVEETGAALSQFAVGEEVFGITGGANAEYVCVRESGVVAPKPARLAFEQAAAVPDGALLALSSLRSAAPLTGKRVLVYGAAGSIGTAAVQLLAHHFGVDVSAVCDTKDVHLVRSLGARTVYDRLAEDFSTTGERYDVVFDAVGKHSFRRSRRALRPGGLYVTTDLGYLYHVPLAALASRFVGSKRAKLALGKYGRDDLLLVKRLVDEGKYQPVVDRTYALADVVDAHRYVESGQKTGNVVLAVAET